MTITRKERERARMRKAGTRDRAKGKDNLGKYIFIYIYLLYIYIYIYISSPPSPKGLTAHSQLRGSIPSSYVYIYRYYILYVASSKPKDSIACMRGEKRVTGYRIANVYRRRNLWLYKKK